MEETYYSLLGVAETVTAAEIKTAYLRLIREVHPDRIANAPTYWQRQAEEKSKEVNEAYAVLSNDEKRRLYDAQLASSRGYRATAVGIAAEPSDPAPPSSAQQHQATSPSPDQNDARTDWQPFQSEIHTDWQPFHSDTRIDWQPILMVMLVACLLILGVAAIVANASRQGFGSISASQRSEEPPNNSWRYTRSTDEMTGDVSQTACLFSENKWDEKMQPGELCSYKGWQYPAVLKLGGRVIIGADPTLESLAVPGVPGSNELMERARCAIRMRVDDKPGFEVCGNQDTRDSEVNLYDSPYANHRPIITVLKKAKIIKIELRAAGLARYETRIFTFKTDKPLDPKW